MRKAEETIIGDEGGLHQEDRLHLAKATWGEPNWYPIIVLFCKDRKSVDLIQCFPEDKVVNFEFFYIS